MTGFLYDDQAGVRHNVTLKYYDNSLGSRRALSNNFRFDPPTAPPPPPPPPPPTPTVTPIPGIYPSSRITDSGVKAAFGQYPMAMSSYWQLSNYKQLVSVEGARMAQGCHIVNLLASLKDTTANPTAAVDNLLAMLAGNPPSAIVDYLGLSQQVAAQYPNQTYTVHPLGEVEVNYNTTKKAAAGSTPSLGSIFAHFSNDETSIMQALGDYHQAFFDLCDQIAPALYRTYWMGGSQSVDNNRIRNTFFARLTNPHFATSDPYQNAYQPSNTPIQTWTPDVNLYTSPSGAHYAHWLRWGKPQVAFNEIGISHNKPSTGAVVYSDAEMAAWISKIYESMVTLKIRHAMYFNSAGPNGQQFITGGSYPLAVNALSGEFTQAKQAAGIAA